MVWCGKLPHTCTIIIFRTKLDPPSHFACSILNCRFQFDVTQQHFIQILNKLHTRKLHAPLHLINVMQPNHFWTNVNTRYPFSSIIFLLEWIWFVGLNGQYLIIDWKIIRECDFKRQFWVVGVVWFCIRNIWFSDVFYKPKQMFNNL